MYAPPSSTTAAFIINAPPGPSIVPEIFDIEPPSIVPERFTVTPTTSLSIFICPPIFKEDGSILKDLSAKISAFNAPSTGPTA